jgi:hypothetical protein
MFVHQGLRPARDSSLTYLESVLLVASNYLDAQTIVFHWSLISNLGRGHGGPVHMLFVLYKY